MRRIPGIRRVFRHERGSDVDVELQFHIDARTDDLVRLGLDRDEVLTVAPKTEAGMFWVPPVIGEEP